MPQCRGSADPGEVPGASDPRVAPGDEQDDSADPAGVLGGEEDGAERGTRNV